MILSDQIATELWYTALRSEFGLRLILANPKDIRNVQNLLYRVRSELTDDALSNLALCLPAGGKEIWLVQKGHDLNEAPPIERTIDAP